MYNLTFCNCFCASLINFCLMLRGRYQLCLSFRFVLPCRTKITRIRIMSINIPQTFSATIPGWIQVLHVLFFRKTGKIQFKLRRIFLAFFLPLSFLPFCPYTQGKKLSAKINETFTVRPLLLKANSKSMEVKYRSFSSYFLPFWLAFLSPYYSPEQCNQDTDGSPTPSCKDQCNMTEGFLARYFQTALWPLTLLQTLHYQN